MRRRGWTKRDDDDLCRLFRKAGGERALLERLTVALETAPRREGRRKGAVSAVSRLDALLLNACEEYKRLGVPCTETLEAFLEFRKKVLGVLAKHGLKSRPPYFGASTNAIAKRLRRKRKDI